MSGKMELTGDVGGKHYKVEVEDGRVTRVWCRTTQAHSYRREPFTYWLLVWPRKESWRPGAGRRIAPVLKEAEAAQERQARAAEQERERERTAWLPPTRPAVPWWWGRMSGSPRPVDVEDHWGG
jgi:hypothetical protein